MSDTDSHDYLQSDFDPTTLTVPHLRSILVSHDISYPSTAKKPQLVEIFINEVLPLRSKILRDRDHARRSSRGITNVNAYSNETFQTEEQNTPRHPRSPQKSDREMSSKIRAHEVEGDLLSGRVRNQSPAKKHLRPSSKHARTSDNETGIDLDARRRSSRKSHKGTSPSNRLSEAPGPKYDVVDDGAGVKIVKRRESAFTYDNPFQSGSSPSGPLTPEKRKSLGASAIRERRKASGHANRRRTDIPQINDGIFPPSRANFEAPVKLTRLQDVEENGIEVGEEFTPEEQLELSRERASKAAISPSSLRQEPKSHSTLNLRRPFWVVMLALVFGYAIWYRQEKIAIGYCGVGRSSSFHDRTWQGPAWARIFVEPECEPCPQHAYCSDGMQIDCEHDYLLEPHPLSLGGLIPLASSCKADGVKPQRVAVVANRMVETLRKRKADYECGDSRDSGSTPASAEIDADVLKEEISKSRGKSVTEAEFEELWTGAMAETKRRDEVIFQTDGIHTNLSSTSVARLPLLCALRRSIRNTLAEYRIQIGGLICSLLLLLYARTTYHSWQQTNASIPHLVSLTLQRLSQQAALYDDGADVNRWISVGQLRDDVLRDEHSITKRETLWRKVRNVVETNANIRCSQKEDRNGEVSRVWEWIGAVDTLEGSARRRQSARVTREVDQSSPKSFLSKGNSKLKTSLSRSNEPRPVY